MLGIIIGIAAVITIVAIGEGYKNKTIKDFTGENEGKVVLEAMLTPKDVKNTNTAQSSFNNNDKKAIERLDGVESVEYLHSQNPYGEFVTFDVRGVSFQGMASKVEKTDSADIIGRNLNESDNRNATRAIVLNESILKNQVGKAENLVGGIATINGVTFEIIGIIKNNEDAEFSFSFTPDIQMPKNTYNKFFPSNDVIQGLNITLAKGAKVKDIVKKVEDTLNEVGSKRAEGEYNVMDTSGMIKIMGTVLNTLTLFIAGVAGISLFIAGIGVMNMVYTSVSERTLEIGIKRSIGARRKDIRREFLIEGVVITVVGGLIGYILGIIIANIVSHFMKMIVTPSLFTASLAIGISIFVGIVSSIIPANKAANANTIDILK